MQDLFVGYKCPFCFRGGLLKFKFGDKEHVTENLCTDSGGIVPHECEEKLLKEAWKEFTVEYPPCTALINKR